MPDTITFNPSDAQSEMGHPWSAVEKGQAPLEIWRYQKSRLPGQSSETLIKERNYINIFL